MGRAGRSLAHRRARLAATVRRASSRRRSRPRCDGRAGSVDRRRDTLRSQVMRPRTAARAASATRPLRSTCHTTARRRPSPGHHRLGEVERWWPHTHGEPAALPRGARDRRRDDRTGEGRLPHGRGRSRRRRFPVRRERHCRSSAVARCGYRPTWCRWRRVPTTCAPRSSCSVTGMNMVRVAGHSIYESAEFWDLCDELGVMVWQDCMLAAFDPPEDDDFARGDRRRDDAGVDAAAGPARARPGLREQRDLPARRDVRAAPGSWESTVLEADHPGRRRAGAPRNSLHRVEPDRRRPAVRAAVGVAHYFGVGAYERPLSDAVAVGRALRVRVPGVLDPARGE